MTKPTASQVLWQWTTIYRVPKWYILTDEARNAIEDAYVNRESGYDGTKIRLEVATGRNGTGKGSFEKVEVGQLAATLNSYLNG